MTEIENSSSILIVDDNTLNLDLLSKILTKSNFQIVTAVDGIDAIEKVAFYQPELILLDIMMPRLNGFETCRQLKQNPLTRDIPIIFMTALADTENKVKGFNLGASDYVTKPFQKKELLARIKSHLQLFNLGSKLKNQNNLLQKQVIDKYEAELQLLEANEQLETANSTLKAEIENRKLIEIELQQEIGERRQITKELKKTLEEKELLLKEIHHRVKNNLFIVSSLLDLQTDHIDSPTVIKMLDNSQNRIMSMALIHEQLYGDTSLSRINFEQYITDLTDKLNSSYLTKEINFYIDVEEIYFNIETATPCGLIVNELVTNSAEHAFKKRSEGNIWLSAKKDSLGTITLIVKDDGIGFTDSKVFYESESLGMNLIFTLVEQIEGKLELKGDRGTEVKITFSELDYQNRM
ncbi:MAG: response regulator [Pleurocapsa sp. MO_192.B19]|nr:response regulator [Pleurocapsa sp. MO_192.B19]